MAARVDTAKAVTAKAVTVDLVSKDTDTVVTVSKDSTRMDTPSN